MATVCFGSVSGRANTCDVNFAHKLEQRRHRTRPARSRRGVAASSDPPTTTASPTSPPLPDLLRTAILRTRYTSAIGLRCAFYFSQGLRTYGSVSSIEPVAAAIVEAVWNRVPMAREPALGGEGGELSDGGKTANAEISEFLQQHLACYVNLFRTELQHLEDGHYKFPYDLNPATTPSKQRNPMQVAALAKDVCTDEAERSRRRDIGEAAAQELFNTVEVDAAQYPAYYLQNFHYQTDGWMSAESARLYDFQVETVFLGAKDTMTRAALPYMTQFMQHRSVEDTKLLDVASGTGRFLTNVRDNFPELQCTALELSPHYLDAVRVNNERFTAGSLQLVEANVEHMPFGDAEFDMLTAVYLFHELPYTAQRNAVREFARVLKPGGQVFFVDSYQQGDGEDGMDEVFSSAFSRFERYFHEPYYRDYSLVDLEALFGEFGLELQHSTMA
eukprot:CAMPEP_0197585764 /NCGR_PEP_ID=MMETSP1326-20131121/7969_1 /TAXON_ID=1155430 /ORGANISM="Genus nov. species nov., Strain RCC2288" /LENGTH=444 /DNA_ID=CAMNT_0043150313 /DNA_START=48 /DNA_END=1378 /DNA_ORIENTATION=+